MTAAMMLPSALPAARHVAENSFRWRRQRAVCTFLLAYLVVWMGLGLVALGLLAIWNDALPVSRFTSPSVVSLIAVSAWQITPWKRVTLWRCRRSVPLAPRGWKALRSCARFGILNGWRCVASCWPLMLLMATVTEGHLWWSVLLTAVVLAERYPTVLRRRPALLSGIAFPAAAAAAFTAPAFPSEAGIFVCSFRLG